MIPFLLSANRHEGSVIRKSGFRLIFTGMLPLFMLAHFGHHLLTALPVPLLPMIRSEFALDYTQSGLVIAAFSLSYGIGQLPAGWLANRIGPRILIGIGICGVALAGLLVGLSQTYIMMLVFLALMGLLGGGYHPSAPPLVSAMVEPRNRGRALGLHMIGGSASYFLAPLIAAAIAIVWGWRGSFIVLAVPTIIFGIIFYWLLGRLTGTKKSEPKITDSNGEAPPVQRRGHSLVPFLIISTFNAAMITSTVSFVPLFLVDHFGVSREAATAFIAVYYSVGLWASTLGGYLSDRFGRVPVLLTVCLIAGLVIYLLNLVPYGLAFGVVLVIMGLITYIRMPTSEAFIIGRTSERNRSAVLGIYYFSNMEGGGLMTPVLGYLIDRFGFYLSFTMAGAALFTVTLVFSFWLWSNRD